MHACQLVGWSSTSLLGCLGLCSKKDPVLTLHLVVVVVLTATGSLGSRPLGGWHCCTEASRVTPWVAPAQPCEGVCEGVGRNPTNYTYGRVLRTSGVKNFGLPLGPAG